MPLGFWKKGKVLNLKKTLYGFMLHSGSILFKNWKHVEYLSPNETPVYSLEKKVMCICYVDDLIFWSKDEAQINELAILLCHFVIDLE